MSNSIVRVERVSKIFTYGGMWFTRDSKTITAVKDVCFTLEHGEVLGLVGESGSGKTTIGKLIAGFITPDTGTIYFHDRPLRRISLRKRVKNVQMIFQDPFASLNPKLSIGLQLTEAVKQGNWELSLGKFEIKKNITYYLDRVGLSQKILEGYPHQFSGGELQRVVIARALAMQPKIIIADEPVSSLDLSIQAQILNLLKELKKGFELSYIFITHDLAVIRYMADRVLVMKDGAIIEQGDVNSILTRPRNPYTEQLIEAVPKIP